LIVEDDPSARDYFSDSVRGHPELALAGAGGSVAEALAWLDSPGRQVDVLLTDLGLPDGSGIDVIRHVTQTHPACECLVVSMFGDDDNVFASIEAGALGYILKDAAPADIAGAILEMRRGGAPMSPGIARRVLAKLAPARGHAPVPQPALSTRERDVLELLARGFSYAEIGRLQAISVHTVQSHVKNLYRKLAVSSRGEAVFEATQLGLLKRR
jgi:DNA-binding NarL/FixJ family response regulator